MKSKLVLIIVSIAFISCGNDGGKPVLLRLHYAKGDEITYIFQQKIIDSKSIQLNNETEIKFTVDSVIGKNKGFSFTVDLVALKTESNMNDIVEHYDSRKRSPDMTFEERQLDSVFAKSLADDYTIKLDNKGNVTEPLKNWAGKPAENLVEISFLQLEYPEKAVKEGYTWTMKRKNALLNKTNTFVYTVDKITDKEVTVLINAVLSLSPFVTDAKATGRYIIDRTNGHLKSGYLESPLPRQEGKALTSIIVKDPEIRDLYN